MIVDAHCHVWPDHIAAQVLAGRPADLDPVHDGTVDGLLRTMDSAGVDVAVALGVAASGRTLARTNEFVGGLDRSRFVPFGSIHTDLTVDQNLAALRDNGIRGVKLHPIFQGLALDDPAVVEILGAVADEGLPVLAHVGGGGDHAAGERGATRHLEGLVAAVPHLQLLACHFGGYLQLDEVEERAVGRRVVLETSWPPSLDTLARERVRAIIERHGAHRVVFGSDWPMADPAREIAAVRSLGLDPDAESAVLGGNLARLLGLDAVRG